MKSIKLFIAALFCMQTMHGQNSMVDVKAFDLNTPSFFLEYLRDDKSADLFKPDIYAGVEGSPFLFEEWAYARIKLADGRQFDSVLLRVNLYENKVHFKDETGKERMIGAQVKQIMIHDAASKWNNTIFVSGYGDNQEVFYQALADGKKIGLLKKLNTIIKESKVFNAPNKKEFEKQDYLYVVSKGTLFPQAKGCSSLMAAFNSDNKVNKYITDNDIKCNKEKDLIKLVDYYNSY